MVPAASANRVAMFEYIALDEVSRLTPTRHDLISISRTVEPVFEASTGLQNCTLNLGGRENRVQDQVQEVVGRKSSRSLPAGQTPDAIRRPAHLELQLIQR